MRHIPKWIKFIIFVLLYLAVAALSKYDTERKAWFAALVVWLVGTALLIKFACREINAEIQKAGESGGNIDYLAFGLDFGLSFALVALIFVAGIDLDIGFHVQFILSDATERAFWLYATEGLLFLGVTGWICFMLVIAVYFLANLAIYPAFSYFWRGETETSTGSGVLVKLSVSGIGFLLLSHMCGVINIWGILEVIRYKLEAT